MRSRYTFLCFTILLAPFLLHAQQIPQQALTQQTRDAVGARAGALAAGRFIENRGQWSAAVQFFGHTEGLDVWITSTGVVYDAYAVSSPAQGGRERSMMDRDRDIRRKGHRLAMEFIGAGTLKVQGVDRLPGTYNYLKGRDESRWTRGASLYRSTRAHELYPGVDAVFYYDEGRPRYDLIMAPNADPSVVKFRVAGATYTRRTPKGDLAIGTTMGEIVQSELLAYQTVNGVQQRIPCMFTVARNGEVGFDIGVYDRSRPLVIDPLVYSTFLGGSGNDEALSIAVDGNGFAYVGGYSAAWLPAPSDSFPTTVGAYDRTYNGGDIDAFITKLDCRSDTLIYSTMIGGGSFDEVRSIVLDAGNLPIVGGFTGSGDFPTTGGAYLPTYVGGTHDGVVFKLNQNGNALVFSTHVGGHASDAVHSVALMPDGSIRMAGYTSSLDFPVNSSAFDTTFNGTPGDAWVGTLSSSGSALPSATYIGGSVSDAPGQIVVDGTGNAYVTGLTSSPDFPVSGSPYDASYNGGQDDAFIIKVAPGDGALLYSTYMGGTGQDEGTDIDLTPNGYVAYTGFTSSRDFPVTPGAHRTTYGGGAADVFVGQLNITGNSLHFSTYIGSSSDEYGYGLDVAADGRTFVCGTTTSDSFPTTVDAYDRLHKRNSFDCFALALTSDGSALDYSTFVGGTERDVANDIRVGSPTVVYFCGTTKSLGYPITKRRYDDSLGRVRNGNEEILSYDAFVTKLDLRNVAILEPLTSRILCPDGTLLVRWASPRVGNVRVDFSSDSGATYSQIAGSVNGAAGSWEWTVPDLTPGRRYRIRVSAVDDTSVAGYTAFLQVPPVPARIGNPTKLTPCPGTAITLSASVQGMGLHYQWLRDGAAIDAATDSSLKLTAAASSDGKYAVRVTDTCGRDTTFEVSEITTNLPTLTETPQSRRVCAGDPTTFTVQTSVASPGYQWLRNGQPIPGATSATYTIPSVQASDSGAYTVRISYAPCSAQPYTTPPAQLSVGTIQITAQPTSVRVQLGASATFSVTATGTGLTYQWRKNGADIPGATTSTYTIPSVALSDTASYDVVISGPCTKTSAVVTLRIEGIGAVTGDASTLAGVRLLASPNPASDELTIQVAGTNGLRRHTGLRLALYDGLGAMVADLTASFTASGYRSARLDVRELPAGVYYCRLSDGSGSRTSVKVVVE